MLQKSLADTYAGALIKNLKPEQYAEAYEDLTTFAQLYAQEQRIKLLLGNPGIPDMEKKDLVIAIADRGRFLETSKNFLCLLLEKERLGMLSDIAQRIDERIREYEGRAIANVTVAMELSGEQIEQLRNKLSDYFKKNIKLNVTVDNSLVGGIVVRTGDVVIDASLVNTLNTIKESLIKGW